MNMSASKILTPCLQLEAVTEFECEELIFRWKLKLPLIKNCLLYEFESPIFIGGKKSQHSWKLCWSRVTHEECKYEMGIDGVERIRHFLTKRYQVDLVLVAIGNTDDDKKMTCSDDKRVQAHAVISFKDPQHEDLAEIKRSTPDVVFRSFKSDTTLRMESLKETEFWDETNGYVVHNNVTIFCRIIINCGAKNSPVSNSVVRKIILP